MNKDQPRMKAIRIEKAGGVEVLQLQDIPIPECAPDEILVQVKVAGLNFIDIYTRTGLYKPPHYPFTPGKEGSGVIVKTGNRVSDLKEGDRVAFCSAGSGTYAEFVAIPANQVVKIPDSITFEIAAAAMLQGLTAYYLSHLTFLLEKDNTALIHAGAGGVGLLLIQMAKLIGARVITTVSTEDKANLVKSYGADDVVIYTHQSFLEEVMKITHEKGVNVVYDSVGKTTFEQSLQSLAIRGMLISFGQSSGPVPPFELSKLSMRSLYLTRPSLVHYTRTKTELNDLASPLFELITKQQVKITIGQRYSLAEAAKAHSDLESRKTIGKSILILA